MLKNYFKVAVRNILKYKFYSAINIVGMTIGITACLLIIIYVTDELSYDRFHEKVEWMYQVGLHGKIAGQDIRTADTCPPLAAAMVNEIPGIEQTTRIVQYYEPIVKNGDKIFTEKGVFFADSNFFKFFTFSMSEGDPKTALLEPNSVVLTKSAAEKYFGSTDVVGKFLTIGNDSSNTFNVTGITPDCPANSHFIYTMLLSSNSSGSRLKSQVWMNNFMYTYFILNKNASVASVENKFKDLVEKYVGPEIEKFLGISLKGMKETGDTYGFFATKVTDIHLRSTTRDDIEPGGNIRYIFFLGAVGIFIIVIACINFMNLSTARSAGRAKEVGLRKTLGSLRGQMIGQFLAESIIYSFIAVLLALVLCDLLLPSFNLLAGKHLKIQALVSPAFIAGIAGLILVVGLIAGSYPAFYLTSFSAVEVLKGKVRGGMKSKGIRSTLVISQFALSIFLIIFTAVVYQQINYMQERDLGIDKHNVLVLHNTELLGNNAATLKNDIDQQTGIVKSSYTTNSFPGINNTTVFRAGNSEQDHIMGVYFADYDHQELMRFSLKEGRYFSKDFPTDSMAILLNEAAVAEFGYGHPLQEEIINHEDGKHERLKVIGVYKDFNFESLKTRVRPLAIRLGKRGNQLMIRYQDYPDKAVATAEKVWKKFAADQPFEYNFLDENFDELFRSEQRLGRVFGVFSGLAIFIACLGLFALAAFTAEQRTKEIGIRKVMGASVTTLTFLLSKEFTRLVLIAFIPAATIAWYVSDQWLQDFEYRITFDPLIMLWSGLGTIIIAWITVCYQAVKAAVSNPVDSLRYE